MLRSLKVLSKQDSPIQLTLDLEQRLPYYIQGPCQVVCDVAVRRESRYYVLRLKVQGELVLNCQRCLHEFTYPYEQMSEIALCPTEDIATQLMNTMDCMVHAEDDLDLTAIVTDELHLFCPEKHSDPRDCVAFPAN